MTSRGGSEWWTHGEVSSTSVLYATLCHVIHTATLWRRQFCGFQCECLSLIPQKEYILVHISCPFWFLGYGTRFKMRVFDPQIQSPSQHCTPLFKGLSDSEIQTLSWSPIYSIGINHQEIDEKRERTKLSRKHVVPAHKTCSGGVRQKNVFKAIVRLRFNLKEMIERQQRGQNSVLQA